MKYDLVPIRAFTAIGKAKLMATLRATASQASETPLLMACLWLQLCHEAGYPPDDAVPAGRHYRSIVALWAPLVARAQGLCSHALSTHQGPKTARWAPILFRDALAHRSEALATRPSLLEGA